MEKRLAMAAQDRLSQGKEMVLTDVALDVYNLAPKKS